MKYIYNDIDAHLAEVAVQARRYGWYIEYRGEPVTEPALFPRIDESRILEMVCLAVRRDCNTNCPKASMNHPLLQIGEYSYVKMCTLLFEKEFTERGAWKNVGQ